MRLEKTFSRSPENHSESNEEKLDKMNIEDDENQKKEVNGTGGRSAKPQTKSRPRVSMTLPDYNRLRANIESLTRQRYNPNLTVDQLRAAVCSAIHMDQMAKELRRRREHLLETMRESKYNMEEYTDKLAEEHLARMAAKKEDDVADLPPMNVPPPIMTFTTDTSVPPPTYQAGPVLNIVDTSLPPPGTPQFTTLTAPPPMYRVSRKRVFTPVSSSVTTCQYFEMGHGSTPVSIRRSPRGSPAHRRCKRLSPTIKAKKPRKMDEFLLAQKLKRADSNLGQGSPRNGESSQIQKKPKTPYVVLPAETRFEALRKHRRVSLDIGGTLIKVVYSSVTTDDLPEEQLTTLSKSIVYDGNEKVLVNFKKFLSMDACVNFLKDMWTDRQPGDTLHCTGGGSYKFAQLLEKELDVQLKRSDEMHGLICGIDFLLKNNVDESFSYHNDAVGMNKFQYRPISPDTVYPFLLVNIGTGISILKVDSPDQYERVGGSSMGGGTFIGLGTLLTQATGFDELLDFARRGDHRKADKLVCDIYGGAYEGLGLPGDLIAGSMAKLANPSTQMAPEDVAKSLLLMISNNIGQMAMLYATRYSLKRVYFGGYFIRQDPITMRTLSFAIDFWTRGEIQALYMKHEGYLGAMGSFLEDAVKPMAEEEV